MLELINEIALKAPWVYQVVFYIGLVRLFMKPLMTFVQEVVNLTPSTKDNELLDAVLDSKIYKGITWVLDYFASLKLPQKKVEAKK